MGKTKFQLTKEQEEYIVDHYYDMTCRQIADIIGCNKSKVTNTWAKHGLSGKMHRIYPIANESMFDKIDNPTSAYYLGLIAADGYIHTHKSNNCKIIGITLQKRDGDILYRFANDLGTSRKPASHGGGGKYLHFEVTSPKIYDDLTKLGLSERKTYGNTVPDIDASLMRYFIRGYFDGDGSITSDFSKKVNITITGYENNLLKIKSYLDNVNIFSNFIEDKRYYNSGNGRMGSLMISDITSKYCFCKHIHEDDDFPAMIRKKELCMKYAQLIENNIDKNRYKMATIYYKYAVQKVS